MINHFDLASVMMYFQLCIFIIFIATTYAFINSYQLLRIEKLGLSNTPKYLGDHKKYFTKLQSTEVIVSPFTISSKEVSQYLNSNEEENLKDLPLTLENVEHVLDSMRSYLNADGGDVKVAGIKGTIVSLELQGACVTCPSSAMTMKMGLERTLKERIPEISEVIQCLPEAPELNNSNIDIVLNEIRPLLAIAGGTINLIDITNSGDIQPSISLQLTGTAAALQSVKLDILQRIQRYFKASIRVEWKI